MSTPASHDRYGPQVTEEEEISKEEYMRRAEWQYEEMRRLKRERERRKGEEEHPLLGSKDIEWRKPPIVGARFLATLRPSFPPLHRAVMDIQKGR
jgi:hypothetical protein